MPAAIHQELALDADPARGYEAPTDATQFGELTGAGGVSLSAEEGATKLVLDHTGFPEGEHDHLASGWGANYWEPLKRYLD